MKEVTLEQIIQTVTQKVVEQLTEQGIKVVNTSQEININKINYNLENLAGFKTKKQRLDMSKYKTPLITERQIKKLHELTGSVIVPRGTIITPKAKEILKEKNISLEFE